VSANRLLSRRALGAAALAASALAVSGCDDETRLDLPAIPGLSQREEPDTGRVAEALAAERAMVDRLVQVQRRHPALRRALQAAVETHQAHVELLDGVVPDTGADTGGDSGTSDAVAADPARAIGALVRLERALSEAHVTTAMRSRSGVLARVVATMSAAAGQQAVVLADLAPPAAAGTPPTEEADR
jgi:hypothetical protein